MIVFGGCIVFWFGICHFGGEICAFPSSVRIYSFQLISEFMLKCELNSFDARLLPQHVAADLVVEANVQYALETSIGECPQVAKNIRNYERKRLK